MKAFSCQNRRGRPTGDPGTHGAGADAGCPTGPTADREEVSRMGTLTDLRRSMAPDDVAELIKLWDSLREAAISDADRHEIDEIFSRQLP
jgi:hypothetical protein